MTNQPAGTGHSDWRHGAVKFGRNLATGGVAAAFSKTMNSPLEVAKLILQTQPERFPGGARQLLVQLPRQEGITAFWQGNGTNILRYFPTQALNFAFKDAFKVFIWSGCVQLVWHHRAHPLRRPNPACGVAQGALMPNPDEYSQAEEFGRGLVAGGVAGGTSLLFVYSLDLARTRLATDAKNAAGQRQYRNLRHCLRKTYQQGGIRALHKGLGVSLAGIIPYRAVYFAGYDALKKVVSPDEEVKTSFWVKWGIGQTNTVIAQLLTYPLDTVRRVQMKAGETQPDGKVARTFRSSWECFRHLYKTGGTAGLFRGCLVNTFRATGAALCIALYDTAQEAFAEE